MSGASRSHALSRATLTRAPHKRRTRRFASGSSARADENGRWSSEDGRGGRGDASVIGVSAYAGLWLQKVTTHEPVGKIGFAAFATAVAQIEGAFTTALMFVLVAWGVDFAVGVARAIADPTVRLVEYKVRHGLLRLLAIPLLAIAAAIIEGMTIAAIAWDPDGKFVLAVCVAMFWEECVSIQRNGQFFYHRLR
ncbi:MAG: phage holin family protein, partial [Halanaeroarchaeum sp.]